jgi:predicted amidohydrolase YtcJ
MDLVVIADRIRTLAHEDEGITVVGIRAGRIAALGTRSDVAAWRGPATRIVDLGSATVTPGLIDSHIHPVLGAKLTRGAALLGMDLDRVRRTLAEHAASLEPGAWVLGWGLDPNVAPGGALSAADIDHVLGGRPALLRLFDGHSALASTAALQAAGIDGPRVFDERSEVVCDPGGSPTGLLLEAGAIALVDSKVPPPTIEETAGRAHDALAKMAALGITTAHALEHAPEAAAVYGLIAEEHGLPLRLRCSPWVQPGTGETDWAAVAALQGTGGQRWQVRGAKLFMDGTVDNGTAWLREPDSLGQSTAPFWPDPAEYTRAITWFDDHDVPTATHAIGDQGVRHVLRALAGASGRVRHRIEHIETIPDDLVEQFATLRVTASMQPTHCTEYTAADRSDNWSTRLGPVRASHGWRIRDLRDAGVRVAFGSDWPIADFDPRGILAAAQLRRRGGAPDRAPIQPEQAISARMALEGYTTHAAWSVGDEAETGSIELGKRADLTAFAVDPLVAPPDELVDAPIMLTVVEGSISHEADELGGAA